MEYFKIGNVDFSMYVNKLCVSKNNNFHSQTNAAGNTVVDYINSKRIIEVGIIPLNGADMVKLQNAIDAFGVSISFRNPTTNAIEENVSCIIPSNSVEYYTIQVSGVMYKAFTLKFEEL